jgi:hypothetical protein
VPRLPEIRRVRSRELVAWVMERAGIGLSLYVTLTRDRRFTNRPAIVIHVKSRLVV